MRPLDPTMTMQVITDQLFLEHTARNKSRLELRPAGRGRVTNGRRTSSSIHPSIAIAAFTGAGLVSMNKILEQRIVLRMQLERLPRLSGPEGPDEIRHRARDDVRGHADDAVGSRGRQQREGIVAAQDRERRLHYRATAHAVDVAPGFLDADDVGAIRPIDAPCRPRSRRHIDGYRGR